MFDLRDAEIIQEVTRCGGFRAAAQKLRLSQSAVSTRVSEAENRLGVRLFDRERHGARLTPIGRRFLDQAERLLTMRDQIVASLLPFSGFAGTIRIGVAESIVHTWLPAMLNKIRQALPDARLELSVDISPVLAQQLLDDDIDAAILLRQVAPAGAIQIPIYSCALDWFAAPSYPVPSGVLTRAELVQFPIVTFLKNSLPFTEVERLFSDPSLPAPLLNGCASLSTMIHLVRDGFGIGLLPTSLTEHNVSENLLVPLNTSPETKVSGLEFSFCYLWVRESEQMELVRQSAEAAAGEH